MQRQRVGNNQWRSDKNVPAKIRCKMSRGTQGVCRRLVSIEENENLETPICGRVSFPNCGMRQWKEWHASPD
jgi:hypothetical protein